MSRLKKIKQKISAPIIAIETAFLTMSSAAIAACGPGMGGDDTGVTVKTDGIDMNATLGNVIGFVCTMMLYRGALLGAWAVAQLFLAFKNEDADSKSKAMMTLVAAVGLMSVKFVLQLIGLIE